MYRMLSFETKSEVQNQSDLRYTLDSRQVARSNITNLRMTKKSIPSTDPCFNLANTFSKEPKRFKNMLGLLGNEENPQRASNYARVGGDDNKRKITVQTQISGVNQIEKYQDRVS